jgi:hypothetical protein
VDNLYVNRLNSFLLKIPELYRNRSGLVLALGIFISIKGFISPWFTLSSEALKVFQTNLLLVNMIRITVLILFLLAISNVFYWQKKTKAHNLLIAGLILTFFLPYLIVTFNPTLDFITTAYFNQASNIIDKVDINFPEVQSQWKQNISLLTIEPPESTFALQISNSRFFQIPSMTTFFVIGLGFKNTIFTFIGGGWVSTIAGLIFTLFGLYLAEEEAMEVLYINLKFWSPKISLILGLILVSIIAANIVNYNLDVDFAKGENSQVIKKSKILSLWYPPVIGDERFLERLAKADFYLNGNQSTMFDFIKGLENYRLKNYQQAQFNFANYLAINPKNFLTRGYLATSIINQGVLYITDKTYRLSDNIIVSGNNIRKAGGAITLFQEAEQKFPDNIVALYDLMLASVVDGKFELSAQTGKKIITALKIYQNQYYFKSLMGQSYLHLGWSEYKNGDLNSAWKRYFQSTGELPGDK